MNTDREVPFIVEPGMRVAQLVIAPVASVRLVEVTELAASERGDRGFGSSSS
jgi:dUTP pyrophosphatase